MLLSKRNPYARGGSRAEAQRLFFPLLLVPCVLVLAGCMGPVSLHQAVLGYDKTVHRLESEWNEEWGQGIGMGSES